MDTSKAKKTKKTLDCIIIDTVAVDKVRVIETSNGDLIFFNLMLNGVTIYSCRVVNGQNGDFISFPQQKGKDGKYYNLVYAPLSEDDTKSILDEIQAQLNAN